MTKYIEEAEKHIEISREQLDARKVESLKAHEKITQIIPAPKGLYAYYRIDKVTGKRREEKIICLGLTNMGSIWNLGMDYRGNYYRVEEMKNFICIKGMLSIKRTEIK